MKKKFKNIFFLDSIKLYKYFIFPTPVPTAPLPRKIN